MSDYSNKIANGISRRHLLKLGAAGIGAMALPSMPVFASSASKAVGLQLYTLRDMMGASVSDTLKLVAQVGYKELEFAGYFGHSPKEIRAMMNDNGLSSPSAHIPLDTFRNDGIQKVIELAQEIGHQYVVVPYLTEEQRGHGIDTYKVLAEECNRWGEACRKQGLTLAYHNHAFEFDVMNGEMPYDVLLNEVEAQNMAMEMDLYWVLKAKQDPFAYFQQHAGRFKLWHVKDMDAAGNFADVGTGVTDFAPIFAAAQQAGVEHYFVERDQTDDKLKTIQQGYLATAKLLG